VPVRSHRAQPGRISSRPNACASRVASNPALAVLAAVVICSHVVRGAARHRSPTLQSKRKLSPLIRPIIDPDADCDNVLRAHNPPQLDQHSLMLAAIGRQSRLRHGRNLASGNRTVPFLTRGCERVTGRFELSGSAEANLRPLGAPGVPISGLCDLSRYSLRHRPIGGLRYLPRCPTFKPSPLSAMRSTK